MQSPFAGGLAQNPTPSRDAVFNRLLEQKGLPEFPVVFIPRVASERELAAVPLEASSWSHLKRETQSIPYRRDLEVRTMVRSLEGPEAVFVEPFTWGHPSRFA